MADEPVLTDEVLLCVLKRRGYEVEKLNKRAPALTEGDVKRLAREAVEEARQPDPQEEERRFAENYKDALNRSRTRWLGEADDGS
jgi:hypothetical protein